MITSSFYVSRDHPSLEGHFPGNPIVPGVVAIDLMIEALLKERDDSCVSGFPQVKFHSPIYPDQEVSVQFTRKNDYLYEFICQIAEVKVISGKLKLAPKEGKDG